MILRRPGALVASYGSLPWLPQRAPPSSSTTSPRLCRNYASNIVEPSDVNDEHTWPTPPTSHRHPTPYQIFELQRGSPYSKRRFYDLVKLYHPDRCSSPGTQHPSLQHVHPAVRLERYRLIVAAHTILSDPLKRSAYDRSGAGWDGRPDPGTAPNVYRRETWGPDTDPMYNATWEDWERWYARMSREAEAPGRRPPQTPVYLSNAAFVATIMMLVVLGSIGQATRANARTERLQEHREVAHTVASQELRQKKDDAFTRGPSGKDESTINFLMRMDPTLSRREAEKMLLSDREYCGNVALANDMGRQ